ncbi:MAG: PIN domain protein [Kiritimatiellae bacterium]|jgi:hypothetical protein|nr:PIN domain protein [Kiritimatiellia bacterium]
MRIYLDNCCFNRPYDDQLHIRIKLETEAKLRIQDDIRNGLHQLVWSYILDYENGKNPFNERSELISKWGKYAIVDISESKELLHYAKMFLKCGFKKYDSLHIACAIIGNAEYFVTTDDGILRKSNLVEDIQLIDPIGFIKEVIL